MNTPDLNKAEKLLTNLEELEAKLRQLEQGLTRSHRLATLGTMASIIAHEFNNILTPVISYCQLALANPDDTELMKKALGKAFNGSTKAAEISNSMLGFARNDDTLNHCLIHEIIDEVFNCLARSPQKDGIKLYLDIPSDLNVAISPIALQQILLNLILNARQAMRPKGGELHIIASQQTTPVNTKTPSNTANNAVLKTVTITVTDTGPGIPENNLPHIFDPFFTHHEPEDEFEQVADAEPDSSKHKGTGLGLAVCNDIIQKASGSITVESTQNIGTTFIITLPQPDQQPP